MTPPQPTPDTGPRPESRFWSRLDTAHAFSAFSDPAHPPFSQRQYARLHGIPRSTLGDWLRRDFHLLDPELSFFRSAAGHSFLRRLVLALLLVFHHQCPCGLRHIALFLELAGLDLFVGPSYGALHALDSQLQDLLILFGGAERQRLAAALAAAGTTKDIILCPDENFHGPHVCLVAIEPVSNFIAVEQYAESRDSVTWAVAINAGLDGLPVHLVCLTSDQASGLVCCAEKELEVQHHPDLMHLQHNLGKPILLPLARPITQAEKDLEMAKEQERRLEWADQKKPDSVTVEMWMANIRAEDQAKEDLEQARQRLGGAVEEIRALSGAYHPFDRETGQAITPEQMQVKLGEALTRLQEVVEEAGLGERPRQAVRKAREGWVVLLVGCLSWFWAFVRQKVEKLELSEEEERVVTEELIGGHYWEMGSVKEEDPEQRDRLKALAARLKEKAWGKGSALAGWEEGRKKEVEAVARQCAELFQRSSSCVEGRNGRLSLFHHGQTRLTEKRLKALTVVHNYVVKRPDGTTAAERFFGAKQREAFAWLLQRLPDLPRPAAKRRQLPSQQANVEA